MSAEAAVCVAALWGGLVIYRVGARRIDGVP